MSNYKPIKEDSLLTVHEVAEILKLNVLTVYKYIKSLELEAIAFGGHYRISRESLTSFVERNIVGKRKGGK